MLEFGIQIHPHAMTPTSSFNKSSGSHKVLHHLVRISIRMTLVAVVIAIAIAVPNFESVTGLMGSALCFSTSVILPLLFYLRLRRESICSVEQAAIRVILVISIFMAIVGTAWPFVL